MQELEQWMQSGQYTQILRDIAKLNEKQQSVAQKYFAAFIKNQIDGDSFSWPLYLRAMVANAAVARNPKTAIDAFPRCHTFAVELVNFDIDTRKALVQAIAAHGREWVIELITILAKGKTRRQIDFDVVLALLEGFQLPIPDSEAIWELWTRNLEFRYFGQQKSAFSEQRDEYVYRQTTLQVEGCNLEVGEIRHQSFAGLLRCQTSFLALLSMGFAMRDRILSFQVLFNNRFIRDDETFEVALQKLIQHGHFPRSELCNQAIAALNRSDSVGAQRLQASLLVLFDPKSEDVAHNANTLLSLLSSCHGSAASLVQTLLRKLDIEHALTGEFFLNACQRVFSRKEKGMRNEQLTWAKHRLNLYSEQTNTILLGVAQALLVDELNLQKKASEIITSSITSLDQTAQIALTNQIEAAATYLDPSLYEALTKTLASTSSGSNLATDLQSTEIVSNQKASTLNEVIGLQEIRPNRSYHCPVADLPTLREIIARYDSVPSVLLAEQMIDLALQLAEQYSDVDGSSKTWMIKRLVGHWPFRREDLATITDRTRRPALASVALWRQNEIYSAIEENRPYAYLSKPSFENGSISAEDLIARLSRLSDQKQEAAPIDFLVALMRTQQPNETQIKHLQTCPSSQAHTAAEFFCEGGMSQMETQVVLTEVVEQGHFRLKHKDTDWVNEQQSELCVNYSGMAHAPKIENIPLRWTEGFNPENAPAIDDTNIHPLCITGMMPNNGEILAAMHLWGFRAAGHESSTEGGKATVCALPLFLDARGVAGPAMHLAILFSLSANDATARLAGSDGLIELIAQQRYDCELACRLISQTIKLGTVKVGRIAKSLVPIVDAGVASTIWPMIRSAIQTSLNAESAPAGTVDLIALAYRVVYELKIREEIPTVVNEAAKKGNTKLLIEVRRLHAQLLAA
nr:DUF6493 family protein [uncultured Undibacterium sp.]